MELIKNKIGKYEQKLASKSLAQVANLISTTRSSSIKVELRIEDSVEVIEIPFEALSLLKDVLSIMAEGNDLMVVRIDSEISTQDAADILNISRPYLVKLLESGQIPFTKAGTHRRVLVKDIIEYKSKLSKERRKNLNLLAKQAQELNLGY